MARANAHLSDPRGASSMELAVVHAGARVPRPSSDVLFRAGPLPGDPFLSAGGFPPDACARGLSRAVLDSAVRGSGPSFR